MKLWQLRPALIFALAALVVPVAVASDPIAEAATASVFCGADPQQVSGPEEPLESYSAVSPIRLVDTRNGIGGLSTPVEQGCTMRVGLGSDVPAEATAVALSVTAVSEVADFFTIYPCTSGRPDTSNLNSRSGFPTPNLVVAIPDANGEICIFSHGGSHLIVDLAGWWSEGPDRFASVEPERIFDSRSHGVAKLAANEVREIAVPSTVVPLSTQAVVINITATNPVAPGFLVAFPCGYAVPVASNLNFDSGEDRAVGAIVGLGLELKMCVSSSVSTDVIVDVTGYYAPAPAFGPAAALQPLSGKRVLDTRGGVGGPAQPFAALQVRALDPVAGLSSSDEAAAVVLNLTSTNSREDGFVSLFPCGDAVPEVSSLNFSKGSDAANLAIVKLGAERTVCIVTSVTTDIVVDLFGVMVAPDGSFVERMTFDAPVYPPFDPDATDYAIQCGAGSTDLAIGLELLPFATAIVDQPLASTGSGTIARQLQADDLLTMEIERGGQQRSYHFRCLPADFPQLVVDRPGSPTPGWYLTTYGFGGSSGTYSVIFDEYGAPVWYKRTPEFVFDFKLLSDGNFVYNPQLGTAFGTDPTGGHWITDLDGNFIELHLTDDPVTYPDDQHDYEEIPGVGRAMLSYPLVAGQDLSALGAGYSATDTLVDGVIRELDMNGVLLWDWSTLNHFDGDESLFPLRYPYPGQPGDVADVFHINSIDREPDGDYIVGARHLDAAFRVDHGTGDIEWILGGPVGPAAKRLTILGDPYLGPKRPHDVRLEGNIITMMDNRTDTGQPSRAVSYEIDTTNMTATMRWEIRERNAMMGGTLGSVREAADGSVLIGWGAPVQPLIEEYDADHELVLAITQVPFGFSYRTIKYPASTFDRTVLRNKAGGLAPGPP